MHTACKAEAFSQLNIASVILALAANAQDDKCRDFGFAVQLFRLFGFAEELLQSPGVALLGFHADERPLYVVAQDRHAIFLFGVVVRLLLKEQFLKDLLMRLLFMLEALLDIEYRKLRSRRGVGVGNVTGTRML